MQQFHDIRHRIIRLYFDGKNFKEVIREVNSINPLDIYDDGKMDGFYFKDLIYLNADRRGGEYGCSGVTSTWDGHKIWFGEIHTYDELVKTHDPKYRELINFMEQHNIKALCKSRNGHVFPVKTYDKTYDQVCKEQQQGSKNK